jgi:hypothetical protein
MTLGPTDEEGNPDVHTKWRKTPIRLTRGWAVFCVLFAFAFMGLACYAAVSTARLDNRVTAKAIADSAATQVATCVASNLTRADAKTIATSGVEADRRALDADRDVWDSIDHTFPNGLPPDIRASLDASFAVRDADLDARQDLIDVTYMPRDCDELARALAPGGDESVTPDG